MKNSILIAICLCFYSCDTDYIVDSRLKSFVDTFYHEANIRGRVLEKNNLIIKLKKNLAKHNGVLGASVIETGLFTNKQETIFIDEDFFFNATVYQAETIIFHELGHTLLNRRYHTDQIPSVMNANSVYCGYCYGGYYNNCVATEEQRSELLDELFSSNYN